MAVLRYAQQEARNIAKAQAQAVQQSRLNASLAERRAESLTSSLAVTKLQWADAPVSAAAAGTAGQIAYDAGYIYVCVGLNEWKRAALSTW